MLSLISKAKSSIAKFLYLKLSSAYGKSILSCQDAHYRIVRYIIYVDLYETHPDLSIKDRIKVSGLLVNHILSDINIPTGSEHSEIAHKFLAKTRDDKNLCKMAANYLLLGHYLDSFFTGETETGKKLLKKAKLLEPRSTPIKREQIKEIISNTRKIEGNILSTANKLDKDFLQDKEYQAAAKLKITPSDAAYAATVFSALFLISGFLYNNILLSHFGIEVGDFFTISDYLSSSVDILFITAISSLAGLASFSIGLSRGLSDNIKQQQTGIKAQKSYIYPLFIIFLVILTYYQYYKTGSFSDVAICLLVFALVLEWLPRLPLIKHFENPISVLAFIFTIILFGSQLAITIIQDIKEIDSDTYINPYHIIYNKKYSSLASGKVIQTNSNYIFLWNKKTKMAMVIPRSSAMIFYSKPNTDKNQP